MKTQLELRVTETAVHKKALLRLLHPVNLSQLLCHSRKRTYVLRVCYSFKTNSASENPITQQCIVQVVQ